MTDEELPRNPPNTKNNRAAEAAKFLRDEDEENDLLAMNAGTNKTKVVSGTGDDDLENQTENFMDEPQDDDDNDNEKSEVDDNSKKQQQQQQKKRRPLHQWRKKRPRTKVPTPGTKDSGEQREPLRNRILVIALFLIILGVAIVLLTRGPTHADDNDTEDDSSVVDLNQGTSGNTGSGRGNSGGGGTESDLFT